MKQSDIITIVLVAGIGTFIAAMLCNLILGNPDEKSVTFKTVQVIEADLAEPDPEVFNVDAINPTIEVYVGDCEDVDQNGVLDEAELIACGRAEGSGQQNMTEVDGEIIVPSTPVNTEPVVVEEVGPAETTETTETTEATEVVEEPEV